MKNKYQLKKYLNISFIIIIALSIIFLIIETIEFNKYSINTNNKILSIINIVKEKYPNISDNEILEIINSKDINDKSFIKKYSIDIEKDILVNANNKANYKFNFINVMYFIFSLLTIILIFIIYNNKKDKEINSITKCIEEINKKNYKLDLNNINEDELSILKNEIYKTTIMLKEEAENSINDKVKLKDSLSDISHQLKTPLTSIMIMLDNIIDNPNMKPEIREDFIKEIKIEITNISFLVQAILKLSKLDSNTVEYINKDITLNELVSKAINRLLPLCDLKNIKLELEIKNDDIITCDEMWQVEAISNIIKNCIEHSKTNGIVNIVIDSNKIYSIIKITDYGVGITKMDLPNIFDRFYKGKNSDINSIGIGLALSKAIIYKNNGTISVESQEGKGSCFTIKYYK